MQMFWTFLAAYIVGWVLCNIFLFQLVIRFRGEEKAKQDMAKRVAAEYWKLAHPEAIPAFGELAESH